MIDYFVFFDCMFVVWNEFDFLKVRSYFDVVFLFEVYFVDLLVDVCGIDGFEENVYEV